MRSLHLQSMAVQHNDDNICYQYKVIDGIVANSLAGYTALAAGIPEGVVQRGIEVQSFRSSCAMRELIIFADSRVLA